MHSSRISVDSTIELEKEDEEVESKIEVFNVNEFEEKISSRF